MTFQPLNFRPIVFGTKPDKSPQLFRSNALEDNNYKSIQWLRETVGIKSYVDLREANECPVENQLNNFYITTDPYSKITNQDKHFGNRYKIEFITAGYILNFIMFRLKLIQIVKILILLVQHLVYKDYEYQRYGGQCFSRSINLGEFYCSLVDDCSAVFRKIFYIMVNKDNFPMLIGCSFGKDRTGITSALVMSLAGCSDELIISEYAKSEANLSVQRRAIEKSFEKRGCHLGFCGSPPEAMKVLLGHLRNRYGSTEDYLLHCGLTVQQIQQIKINIKSQ